MVAQHLAEPKEGECIMDPQRTLSEADVKAIAKAVLDEGVNRWYMEAGKSFTKIAAFAALACVLAVALYFYAFKGK